MKNDMKKKAVVSVGEFLAVATVVATTFIMDKISERLKEITKGKSPTINTENKEDK